MRRLNIGLWMVLLVSMVSLAGCRFSPAGSGAPQNLQASGTPPAAILPSAAVAATATMEPTATQTTRPPTETSTPTATVSFVGPDSFPDGINPLTGMVVDDPDRLERRPVMIKVSNYPASLRPHSGLSYADMVWEYFIGEGMTRFLALFYGQDAPQVGPVRSGRLIDPQLARLYGGFLGMVSADSYVRMVIQQQLPGRVLSERPSTCPALCRMGSGGVNSVFADTAAFTTYVREREMGDQRPDLTGMLFDAIPPTDGSAADDLHIFISFLDQVGWAYVSQRGAYLRSQEQLQSDGSVTLVQLTDRLTGEQLAFENVVLLFAWHDVIKPELVDIDIWYAEGVKALILRDGWIYEATYTAESKDAPLRFFDAAGDPFPFKPGATWFHIVGMGSTMQDLGDGAWKLRFYP